MSRRKPARNAPAAADRKSPAADRAQKCPQPPIRKLVAGAGLRGDRPRRAGRLQQQLPRAVHLRRRLFRQSPERHEAVADLADAGRVPAGGPGEPGAQLYARRPRRYGIPRLQPDRPSPGGADAVRDRAQDADAPGARGPVQRTGRRGAGVLRRAPVGAPSAPDRGGDVHHPADGVADGAVLSPDAVLLHPRRSLAAAGRVACGGGGGLRAGDGLQGSDGLGARRRAAL